MLPARQEMSYLLSADKHNKPQAVAIDKALVPNTGKVKTYHGTN